MPVDVCLEVGSRRVFASAVDFHGWCRSARDEDSALRALADYRGRYADAMAAGGALTPPARPDLRVVERLTRTATTDFGAPGAAAAVEHEPVSPPPGRGHCSPSCGRAGPVSTR